MRVGRRPFTAPEPIARTNPPHIPARHQKTRRSSATAGVSGGSGDGYGGLKGGGHDHRGGPAVGPRGSQGGFALGATTSSSSTGCCADGGSNKGGLGGGNVVGFFLEEEEERAADIEAVRGAFGFFFFVLQETRLAGSSGFKVYLVSCGSLNGERVW